MAVNSEQLTAGLFAIRINRKDNSSKLGTVAMVQKRSVRIR
jgi:hypothetical protein